MWNPFKDGAAVGQKGSEEGEIVRDDEHAAGARITLERGTRIPFAITCGIYGWMVHTRFFSTEEEANSQYEKMKLSLNEILAPLDNHDYCDYQATAQAIEKFVAEYP